jgi:hypothetical protein
MTPTYWFAYAARPHELKRGTAQARVSESLHMIRDGQAFAELMGTLGPDCLYRGCLLNHPKEAYSAGTAGPEHDGIEDGALIVVATRPPLHDHDTARRRIARSGSRLEASILSALQDVLLVCTRTEIVFDHRVPNAAAMGLRASTQGPAPCAGYVIYHPRLKLPDAGHARLLVVFGLDGTQTFLLSNLVRTRDELSGAVQSMLGSTEARVVRVDYGLPPFPAAEEGPRSLFPASGPLPGRVEELTRNLNTRLVRTALAVRGAA